MGVLLTLGEGCGVSKAVVGSMVNRAEPLKKTPLRKRVTFRINEVKKFKYGSMFENTITSMQNTKPYNVHYCYLTVL